LTVDVWFSSFIGVCVVTKFYLQVMSSSNIKIKDHVEGETIDISLCNISEVPLPQIAVFTRITTLNLSGNKLTSLPPNFGAELSHIVKLDLSTNKLKALPETFHELSSLAHLDLYRNQIKDLPASLHHLKKLKFLDLSGNPLNPRIRNVLGPCSTQKECEAAAKNVVAHFNRQKEAALKEKKMAKQHKAEEQRKEAAAQKVVQKDKKPVKKPESKPVKQQSNKANNVKPVPNKAHKKQVQQKTKPCASSCFFTFNKLLLLTLLVGACYTFHVHCEGDYSEAGLKAALPRLQKSYEIFVNQSKVALKPENLRATGRVVFAKSNATAYVVGGHVKDAAYKTQAFLEQYTGDLTPYTSKVSHAAAVAMAWLSAQFAVVYAWLAAQDWQGAYDTCAYYLALVWDNIVKTWTAISEDPRFQSAYAQACQMCCAATHQLKDMFLQLSEYLAKNVPLWLEAGKAQALKLYATVQTKIDSMVN